MRSRPDKALILAGGRKRKSHIMATEVNRSYHGPELLAQEVVERKGPGHPDTLVDGIAEFFSRRSVLASNKKILFLGDDDHMSVVFARFLNVMPTVVEYDTRIRDSLNVSYRKHNIPKSEIIEYDVRNPLPSEVIADAFYINPPYSSKNQGKGAKVWISRVANAVPVGSTSVLVYPIDEKLPWTLTCMNEIANYAYGCGMSIVNIDRDLHTYGYLPKDPGLLSSNIFLYKFADVSPKEIEDIQGESLYR